MGKEKQAEGRKVSEEPSNDKSKMIEVHSHTSPNDYSVAELSQRLAVAELLRGNRERYPATIFDSATETAIAKAAQEGLDLTCTILLLGNTGVGKSATINSIFDKLMSPTDAFQMGTRKVEEIVGTFYGIKIRVIDTPGLDPSLTGYHHNKKVLKSVKHFIKKTPPDIVLYCDRLDMQSMDHEGDLLLLNTITQIIGPEVWYKTILVLTHGAQSPAVEDGPDELPLTLPEFVTQRSDVIRWQIRQGVWDMELEIPVVLVENHSALTHVLENYSAYAGKRDLPSAQTCKAELLLKCLSSKITQARAQIILQQSTSPFSHLYSILSSLVDSLAHWRIRIGSKTSEHLYPAIPILWKILWSIGGYIQLCYLKHEEEAAFETDHTFQIGKKTTEYGYPAIAIPIGATFYYSK